MMLLWVEERTQKNTAINIEILRQNKTRNNKPTTTDDNSLFFIVVVEK